MLEKQKKWCQNKVEKGKNWIDDHKFGIGLAVGVVATTVCAEMASKIFEPKKKLGQVYRGDFDKDGKIDFGIGITEIDRFGIEHRKQDKILFLEEGSKEMIFSQIEQAIQETKEERTKNKT